MHPPDLSPEAVALQSIAKSLDTIAKAVVSVNKLFSLVTFTKLFTTPIRMSDEKDRVSAAYAQAMHVWRTQVKGSVAKRFAPKFSK